MYFSLLGGLAKFAGSYHNLRHVFRPSEFEELGSGWTDLRVRFDNRDFFRKSVKKIQDSLKP